MEVGRIGQPQNSLVSPSAMLTRPIYCSIICAMLLSCSTEKPVEQKEATPTPSPGVAGAARQGYRVLQTLPHDVGAFTQGLVVHDGVFLESTGQYGFSSLRRVTIRTGAVKQKESIDARYFSEGIAVLKGRVYMLTWLNQQGFIYDARTLKKIGSFAYTGEGWGITTDGTSLYMSNGTSTISIHDPDGFRRLRTIEVTLNGSPLNNLNELEWIRGEIWANVWQTETIVRIDPSTGRVTSVIDLAGILSQDARTSTTDVMNGIAWDSLSNSIYVTGKHWPSIFKIDVL